MGANALFTVSHICYAVIRIFIRVLELGPGCEIDSMQSCAVGKTIACVGTSDCEIPENLVRMAYGDKAVWLVVTWHAGSGNVMYVVRTRRCRLLRYALVAAVPLCISVCFAMTLGDVTSAPTSNLVAGLLRYRSAARS